ncbi:MAG: hypothetical protein HYV09_33050 [Deltaproteobacteria bacterium]|nr:hypothetical protein [Deltaproteobacteria bacterium]
MTALVATGGCASLIGLNELEEVDCVGPACTADAADDSTRDGGPDGIPADTSSPDGGDAKEDVSDDTTIVPDVAPDADATASDAEAGLDSGVDTGVVDTGPVDTGLVDTGLVDTGLVDTGLVDTGVVDTGPACEAGPAACGACDRPCSTANVAAAVCAAGLCTSACSTGFGNCTTPAAPAADDGCETRLDTLTNCGACGSACDTASSLGAACDGTKCTYTACKPGFFDCDTSGTNSNGCETPAGAVCGGCSTSCDVSKSLGAACSSSGTKCTYSGCKPGFANCSSSGADLDGCETSTKTITDCSGCGQACDTVNSVGAACTGTTCAYSSCKAGFGNCDSTEPDLDGCETPVTTTANCGGCGVKCTLTSAISASCDGTKCGYACASGALDCNASVAPNTDGCESSRSSVDTCGSCGTRCDTVSGTPSCDGSKCSYVCAAGKLDCDTAAPNTNGCETSKTSPDNCGSCGTKCDTTTGSPSCDGATCSYACAPGKLDCDSTAPNTNGCETSASSTLTCGGCANKCTLTNASGATCDGTKCGYTCSGGYGDCNAGLAPNTDGCETALNTTSNCSGCGLACNTTTGTPSCDGAKCSYACGAGRLDCNASVAPNLDGCESSTTNPASCGACGNACDTATGTPSCDGTKCSYSCGALKLDCNSATAPNLDGCETSSTSLSNCGGCGNVCNTITGTPTCDGAKCGYTCNAGRADCNVATAPNVDGCECETDPVAPGCCSGGCQTKHSNGAGQTWFDCVPLGTHDFTQAGAARQAWTSTRTGTPAVGTVQCGSGSDRSDCRAAQYTTGAVGCGVWCFEGSWKGKMHVNTSTSGCYCPGGSVGTSGTWN